MNELARKTFRAPRGAVLIVALITAGPLVALNLFLFVRYPQLVGHPVFVRSLLRIAGVLVFVVLPWWFIRVPVAIETQGIRFAWFFRVAWADITDATIRRRLGFRTLVLSRRRRFSWQALLFMYDGLPEFLAGHAPDGHPLRRIRDLTEHGSDVHSDAA